MQHAIFLTHRIPFPPNKGDKIRSFHLLRHLARDWRVHLGCFVDSPEDQAHVDALREFCAQIHVVPIRPGRRVLSVLRGLARGGPLTFEYYASNALAAWLDEVRRVHRPKLEYAFSGGVAPYLLMPPAGNGRPDVMRIVDLVDLDSEKWRSYGRRPGALSPLYALEARRLAAAECAITGAVDHTILVSEAEASSLRDRPGACAARVRVVGNGVDLDYFDPDQPRPHPMPGPPRAPAIAFTGAMDYRPNVEGALWFAEQVWPRIAAEHGTVQWWIVGANPDRRILALRSLPRVVVTGSVADMRPWLAHATLAVAPLRIARGVQNKLLEAMAMRRAVVTTSVAAGGLDAMTRSLLAVADDPGHFAVATLRLLDEPEPRRAAGAAGRRRMAEHYGWAARLSALDRLLTHPSPGPATVARSRRASPQAQLAVPAISPLPPVE